MGLMSKIANSRLGKAGAIAVGSGATFVPTYEMLNPPAVYAQPNYDVAGTRELVAHPSGLEGIEELSGYFKNNWRGRQLQPIYECVIDGKRVSIQLSKYKVGNDNGSRMEFGIRMFVGSVSEIEKKKNYDRGITSFEDNIFDDLGIKGNILEPHDNVKLIKPAQLEEIAIHERGYSFKKWRRAREDDVCNQFLYDLPSGHCMSGYASFDTNDASPERSGVYRGLTPAQLEQKRQQELMNANGLYQKVLRNVIKDLQKEGKLKIPKKN